MKLSRHDILAHLVPILLGQASALAIGVVGVRLASHWVAPSDYGVFGLFTSLTPLGAGVVYAGLVKYVARHWAESGDRHSLQRGILVAFVRKLPGLLAAAAAVAAFLPGKWLLVFPALALASTGLAVVAFVQTALQAERRNWRDFALSVAWACLRTLLPLAAYSWVMGDVAVLVGGFALHAVLAGGLALFVGQWRGIFRPGNTTLSTAGVYEGPRFMLLAVVGWVMGASARWIVAAAFGPEQAGFFVLAGNVALVVVSLLYAVVMQFFQPRLFALPCSTREERLVLARHTDFIAGGFTALSWLGAAMLAAAMPWLVGPLVSERYADATGWVLAAGGFHVALLVPQFFHTLLLAARQEESCGPAEVAGSLGLLAGAIAAATVGPEVFKWYATFGALVPWLISRPMARRLLLRPENLGSGIAQRPNDR